MPPTARLSRMDATALQADATRIADRCLAVLTHAGSSLSAHSLDEPAIRAHVESVLGDVLEILDDTSSRAMRRDRQVASPIPIDVALGLSRVLFDVLLGYLVDERGYAAADAAAAANECIIHRLGSTIESIRVHATRRDIALAKIDFDAITPSLTAREREVFALMVRNATASEIAGDLQVRLETVKTHTHNITRKLGVHGARAAVAKAVAAGAVAVFPLALTQSVAETLESLSAIL